MYDMSNIDMNDKTRSTNWSLDLGEQPITVNYYDKMLERAVESTASCVITVITMQHALQACNNETLVTHCLRFITRANNERRMQ